jgi:hypothetical protein
MVFMQSKHLSRSIVRRMALAVALPVALGVTGMPLATPSANAQGLTIFSGVERGQELGYSTDFGANAGQTDRYYLNLKKEKMKLAAAKFVIVFPDGYDGKIDPKKVEITVNKKNVAVSEVNWDPEAGRLEIYPEQPIPAKTNVSLVLSNVINPGSGMHYLNCLVQAPGDVPILRDLGTWILLIDR